MMMYLAVIYKEMRMESMSEVCFGEEIDVLLKKIA